jgi:beta-lactam-binding protein with PASTA domain
VNAPVLVLCAAALLLSGCAGTPALVPPPPPPPPPPTAVTIPTPTTVPEPEPTVVVSTHEPKSWVMPDLVGANLQEAQNAIQALTGYEIPITTSHDESGKGREQLLDRNWKVCSQSVPAGRSIEASTKIDFGTVKNEERC